MENTYLTLKQKEIFRLDLDWKLEKKTNSNKEYKIKIKGKDESQFNTDLSGVFTELQDSIYIQMKYEHPIVDFLVSFVINDFINILINCPDVKDVVLYELKKVPEKIVIFIERLDLFDNLYFLNINKEIEGCKVFKKPDEKELNNKEKDSLSLFFKQVRMLEISNIIKSCREDKVDDEKFIEKLKNKLSVEDEVELIKMMASSILEKDDELVRIKENALYIPERPLLKLPKSAPMLWRDYKAKYYPEKDILDFIREVYGGYLDAGVLYQPDLKRLDKSALDRLRNFCNKNKLQTVDYIPPKSSKIKIEKESIDQKTKREISRLSSVARR